MTNFVIFGASGDLAQNYLFPSLFHLWKKGHQFNYVGFARTPMSDTDFQSLVFKSTGNQKFAALFKYVSGEYNATGLKSLQQFITPDTIYYSALPTHLDIITPLISGLTKLSLFHPQTSHFVIEKPFGTDYASAKQLMDFLEKTIGSESVFLVDHYLTKELVRNLVTLRFANPIFNQLWNYRFIKEINIIATETKGIDARGGYYDQTGAIRDMIQNHCLQLLVLTTMDCPESLEYSHYSAKKLAVLNNLSLYSTPQKSVKIGQYESYQKEVGVNPHSQTETFAEIKFKLNHPEWIKVPITLTTAKKMNEKITEINIIFKSESLCLWGEDYHRLVPNQLTINLYPDNDIVLTINSTFNPEKKLPKPVELRLGSLDPTSIAITPYENVILDVVNGNRLNSPSFSEILAQWQIVDKILSEPNLRDRLFCY